MIEHEFQLQTDTKKLSSKNAPFRPKDILAENIKI